MSFIALVRKNHTATILKDLVAIQSPMVPPNFLGPFEEP